MEKTVHSLSIFSTHAKEKANEWSAKHTGLGLYAERSEPNEE